MDQAIHKLNVGHYTLDVKVSQLMDRLSRMDGEMLTFSRRSADGIRISPRGPFPPRTKRPFFKLYFYFTLASIIVIFQMDKLRINVAPP